MAMTNETLWVRTIDLDYDQILVLDNGPQSRVRVMFGATWLTEEGHVDDAVMRAGDELPLHEGRAVMQALGPTRLQIFSAGRRGLAQSAGAWLRRHARRVRQPFVRLQLRQGAVGARN
jgi:hypothetical protein